jgi:hypothetical protein
MVNIPQMVDWRLSLAAVRAKLSIACGERRAIR